MRKKIANILRVLDLFPFPFFLNLFKPISYGNCDVFLHKLKCSPKENKCKKKQLSHNSNRESFFVLPYEYAHTRAVVRCWERAVTISLKILSSVTNDELT